MNRYFGLHILEGEWHSLLPRYLLLIDRVDGRRILDIGCGSGIGASLLLELGASAVDAIDHRPAVLELARMKHAKEGLDFHVMFWEELNFPDATFDVVTCMDPSSPVTDPSLLQEVNRVLKPGGEYICAIERKPIDGLEVLLPRYGYSDAAESIDLHGSSERPPQVGELHNFFAKTASVVQRPVLSFVFDNEAHEGDRPVDERLQKRDSDDAAVELWFCGDESLEPAPCREIRLPYFSLVERLNQVINELQMRQIRGQHETEPLFDEILDDGPSEVYERERETTNEYRVVEADQTPTRAKVRAHPRDDMRDVDHPTYVREDVPAHQDGLESQLSELSALYHQVRQEFQTVVGDAQRALEERDRYIEHLVGTVQSWQDRFDSDAEIDEPDLEPELSLEEGTNVYQGIEKNAEPSKEAPSESSAEADEEVETSEPADDEKVSEDSTPQDEAEAGGAEGGDPDDDSSSAEEE